jgi:hypothetical protein
MVAPSSNTPSTIAASSKDQAAGTDNGVVPSGNSSTRTEPFVAENGDPLAAACTDTSANGKSGVLKVTAPELFTTDALMSQAQGGANSGVKASYCSAQEKTGASGTTVRDIFSKVITPARVTFALLTILVLWSSADRPERVVWIFSVIACTYLALWIIYLTAAIVSLTVLVSISYIALIAGCITHLSSAAGIFIMLLDMGYAAGLFGYALSEYRQRKGTERSAEHVPTRNEEELNEDRSVFNMFSFYASIMSVSCAACATWLVVCFTLDTYVLVVVCRC